MTIESFIDAAYAGHATNPAAVARRLETGFALLHDAPEHADGFTRLVEHVVLGHLDDAAGLDAWSTRLEPFAAGNEGFATALARARLAGRLSRGDDAVPTELGAADQVRAHGNALLALTRRAAWSPIRSRLAEAEAIAEASDDPAALRAFAAITNNLANDLRFYIAAHRDDPAYAGLMLEAAQLAHAAWGRAGGWLERQRADYQLALCLAAVGEGAEAVQFAQACWQACQDNGADDEECAYALEAVGQACCAAGRVEEARVALGDMTERLARLTAASRSYAEPQRAALAAAIGALAEKAA